MAGIPSGKYEMTLLNEERAAIEKNRKKGPCPLVRPLAKRLAA